MEAINEDITLAELGQVILNEVNTGLKTGSILPIYSRREDHWSAKAYLTELANTKRFLELWSADANLRKAVREHGCVPRHYEIDVDSEALRALWDEQAPPAMPSPTDLRYRAFCLEKLTHRNRLRENSPDSSPAYNAWRARQMKRCDMQLRPASAYGIVHAPFCIELCSGCSVGCWFCGISAPKLDDIFHYTPENAALYRAVIDTLQTIFGKATGKGFCYWATDPMDNPDYEHFLEDFCDITAVYPQTTTALPLQDVERTRRLLQRSRERGGKLDRFSILSLHQLRQVFEAFTPEELLFVEVVTQNQEAFSAKSRAGRAMAGGDKRKSGREDRSGNQVVEGTIACVSGFLISMVKGTVELVSPCEANEKWPLGYIVLASASFTTADDFRAAVFEMKDLHMHLTVPLDEPLFFYSYLTYEGYPDGFSLSSPFQGKRFRASPTYAYLGPLLRSGGRTAYELLAALPGTTPGEGAELIFHLNELYQEGVLKAGI